MSFRCLTAAGLLIFASSLPAVDDPLEAFPAETGVVLRVSAPSALTTKAEAFLNKAAPQFAPLAGQIGPGVGSLIGNPTLAGVDANADLYVAGFPRTEQSPAVVYAVRASDVAAFKNAIGQGYTLVEYEGWMLYSLDGEALKKVQSRIGGEGDSIRGSISESLDPPFGDGELSVFLNVPVLREVYREQIEADRQRFLDKIRNEEPVGGEGPDPREQFADMFIETINDLAVVHGSLTIDDDALRLNVAALVQAETPSAKRLAALEPSELPLLAKLPQGQSFYFAAAGSVFKLYRSGLAFLEPLENVDDAFDPSAKALMENDIDGFALAADTGDDATSPIVMLWETGKPEELWHDFRKFVQSGSEGKSSATTTVALEGETIEDIKFDVVTIERESSAEGDRNANLLRSFFAGTNATGRMGVVDGLFVYTNGEGTMGKAIEAIRGRSPADSARQPAFEKTRSLFEDELNLLLVADVARLLRGGLRAGVESGAMPFAIDPEIIKGIELVPSFVGAATVVEPTAVRGRVVLPAEQVAGLVKLFNVLQGATSRQEPAN